MSDKYQPSHDIELRKEQFMANNAEGEYAERRIFSILKNGDEQLEVIRIEVKDDQMAANTGNLFIEYAQSDGHGGSKPSGINTTKANWWAIWLCPDAVLITTPQRLKEFGRIRGRKKTGGDNGNKGMLLKISDFVIWIMSQWKNL